MAEAGKDNLPIFNYIHYFYFFMTQNTLEMAKQCPETTQNSIALWQWVFDLYICCNCRQTLLSGNYSQLLPVRIFCHKYSPQHPHIFTATRQTGVWKHKCYEWLAPSSEIHCGVFAFILFLTGEQGLRCPPILYLTYQYGVGCQAGTFGITGCKHTIATLKHTLACTTKI